MEEFKHLDLDIKDLDDGMLQIKTSYRNKSYVAVANINNENTCYGIYGGKIDKLTITCEKDGRVIFDYDRGFMVGKLNDLLRGTVKNIVYSIESDFSRDDSSAGEEYKPFGMYPDWIRWIK